MAIHARRLPTDSKVTPGLLVAPDARSEPAHDADRSEPTHHTDRREPTDSSATNDAASVAAPADSTRAKRVEKSSSAAKSTSLPWYRTERWFLVQLASLVPTLLAFVVPRAYRPPFWILGGALLLVGLLIMARNELRRGRSVTDFDQNAT